MASRAVDSTPQVKSASRVFAILELFARRREPLRLKDVADALDLPTSSAAAILKSITAQGYFTFDAKARSYLPSPRLAQLVTWMPVRPFEEGIVFETMRRLRHRTRELIVLAVANGIYLEYVQTLRSSEGLQLYIRPGTRRLLVQTGTGWLFLGRMPEADALAIYDATIAAGALGPHEFSPSDLLERLASHRTSEISFVRARDLLRPVGHWGGGMVSRLLPVPAGHRSLAIGVAGPADRLESRLEAITRAIEVEVVRLQAAVADG